MAIRVECPSCRSKFGVRDEFAGRRGRCPKCQSEIQVPGAAVKSPPPAPAETAETRNRKLAAMAAAAELELLESDDADNYDLAGRLKQKVPTKVATRATLDENIKTAIDRTRRTRTPRAILDAFHGEIEPVPTTWMYRLWIAIVAALMILLPAIYIMIICAVGLGVFYYATHAYTVFTPQNGHANVQGAIYLYFVPLVAGVTIVAFMIKPIFARSTKGQGRRSLDPETEPLLFAFVEGVCATVGSPRPVRIDVDCEVNASAHLEGGILGLFRDDLVLTIGLPLVAGLELKQLAGVLAHEFGHFSQKTGMRVSYLIFLVNMWFARVVYERDAWDEHLVKLTTEFGRFGWTLGGLAQLAVWLTRRILWVLMYLGHAVSGFLSRQMEFDADRNQARMVGGAVFTRTSWRVRELAFASQFAYADLDSSWRQNRLPDNFPKLVLANVPQIPKDMLAKYRKEMGQATTGIFDTHPCDRERIARARAEATEGIFDLDGPATDVFRNFDSLARLLTFEFYREKIGPHVHKEQLYPVAELVQTQAVAREGFEAFQKFFLHAHRPGQPLPLPWDYPPAATDPLRAKAALVAAREEMEATRDKAIAAWKRWIKWGEEAISAEDALLLLHAGCKIDRASFNLDEASTREAQVKLQRAEAGLGRCVQAVEPFTSAAVRRLTTALSILDAAAARIPDGVALRDEARALYPVAAHLGARVTGEITPVWRARIVLERILSRCNEPGNQNNERLFNAATAASSQLRQRLDDFRWKIGDLLDYPFEHAEESISLAKYVLAVIPPRDEVGLLIHAASDALDRMFATYGRALGRLTHAAEEVERILGFPPIPSEPPPEDDEPQDDA